MTNNISGMNSISYAGSSIGTDIKSQAGKFFDAMAQVVKEYSNEDSALNLPNGLTFSAEDKYGTAATIAYDFYMNQAQTALETLMSSKSFLNSLETKLANYTSSS